MVPFCLPAPHMMAEAAIRNVMSDNGAYLLGLLADNDTDPLIKPAISLLRVPFCLRELAAWLLRNRAPVVCLCSGPGTGKRGGEGAGSADGDGVQGLQPGCGRGSGGGRAGRGLQAALLHRLEGRRVGRPRLPRLPLPRPPPRRPRQAPGRGSFPSPSPPPTFKWDGVQPSSASCSTSWTTPRGR